MADNHDKEILVGDDKLLVSMIEQRGQLVEKGRTISKQMEELAAQHSKLNDQLSSLAVETNKLKLNIFRRVEKLAAKLLGEFEIPVTTDVRDGQVYLRVTDALGEFTGSFKRFNKWQEAVPRKEKPTK